MKSMSAKDNPTLTIRSECIDSEGRFRTDFTGRGKDISPELGLDGLVPGTRTLAVTLEDLTHPLFGSMAHWLAWNISPGDSIPAAIEPGRVNPSTGITQGTAYGWHRYRGPKPPRGKTHTYRFTVYALDCDLRLPSRTRLAGFKQAIEGHVLQQATLEGTYE